ncbi:MAG: OsmC family protein [Acidobacteriia bacterium]|nr:OsmC family protein [Terriglobia bacterium]
MEVKVRCLGGKKFEMTARGHQVLSDQPSDNEGTDAAMTPPELFLSSLGACAAYYAEEYLRARALPDEGFEIHLSAVKGDKPVRITKVRMDVIAPGLNQRHRDGILRAVDACLLEKTLVKPPELEVKVISSPEVVEPEPALA